MSQDWCRCGWYKNPDRELCSNCRLEDELLRSDKVIDPGFDEVETVEIHDIENPSTWCDCGSLATWHIESKRVCADCFMKHENATESLSVL